MSSDLDAGGIRLTAGCYASRRVIVAIRYPAVCRLAAPERPIVRTGEM